MYTRTAALQAHKYNLQCRYKLPCVSLIFYKSGFGAIVRSETFTFALLTDIQII